MTPRVNLQGADDGCLQPHVDVLKVPESEPHAFAYHNACRLLPGRRAHSYRQLSVVWVSGREGTCTSGTLIQAILQIQQHR